MYLLVLFAILAVTVFGLLWKRKRLADSLPPGPPPVPILGNLLQFDKKDPRKTFLKWHKTYGPMFTVWLGMEPQVFITGYQLMHETIVKRGEEFADRPKNFIFETLTNGKFGILNSSGEQMKEQRRFTLQVLRNFGFGKKTMEEKVMSETEKFLRAIDSQLNGAKSKVLSVQNDLELCVGNIISSLLVGRVYDKGDKTFHKLKSLLDNNFEALAKVTVLLMQSLPWLRFIPLFDHFGFDDISRNIGDFLEIVKNELERHKKELHEVAEPTDFTGAYLQELRKRKETGQDMSYFSEWQLVAIMGDLWVAGLETTITTLGWAFLLMMRYPEVQRKVQEEMDTVLGREKQPSLADKNQLPYTNAVLQEVQRYANIVPANFGRLCTKDTIVNGVILPKGTTVVPQLSVVHIDDSIYNNPQEFDPERFLIDSKTSKNVAELVPFSLGKRSCLGESLARQELFVIFACTMQKFQLSVVPGQPLPTLEPKVKFSSTALPYHSLVTARF